MWRADPPDALRRELPGEVVGRDDHVVVAERLPLLEPHRTRHEAYSSRRAGRRSARATSRFVAPGPVDQLDPGHLSHPGELAAGVVAVGALDRLDVAREELVEAERRPSGARRARLGDPRASSGAPAATIRRPGASIRAPSSCAVHDQADQRRRMAEARRPELARCRAGARGRRAEARAPARSACGRWGGRAAAVAASRSACIASGPRSAISRSTSSRTSAGTGGRRSRSASAARR